MTGDRAAEPLAARGGRPVREAPLPFSRPSFDQDEIRAVAAVLESGWITTGPRVAELERDLAAACGAAHAVCLDSCTAALHVALAALELCARGRGHHHRRSPSAAPSTPSSTPAGFRSWPTWNRTP